MQESLMLYAVARPEPMDKQVHGEGEAGWEESSRLRILVVDDNHAAAQTLGWMLELFGHEVHLAEDGFSALKVARDVVPPVVPMDLVLPGMSGYEICRIMR